MPPPRHARLADFRVGVVLDDPFCPVTAEVRAVLEQAVEQLRTAGATVAPGWPAGIDPADQLGTYRRLLRAFFQAKAPGEPPRPLSSRQHAADESRRMQARATWQAAFRDLDAFLLPAAFTAAFPHDHAGPPSDTTFVHSGRVLLTAEGPRPYDDLLGWQTFATLAGLPATVAPVGRTQGGRTQGGLPVGIQILGPYLEDATPIALAGHMVEQAGGWVAPPGRVGA